jgi:alpha-1,3-mannosyltransferase
MSSSPTFARQEIVHVVRQYAPGIGGLEEFVAKLAARQRDSFGSVRVVTCNRIFSRPAETLPSHEVIDGIQVDRLAYHGSRRYPVMPGLLRAIETADLVHVHGIDFAFDALAATKVLHRKPLVVTTHGGFFHTQAHATLKKIWFRTLTNLSAKAYRAVVCCSESDRATFAQIAGDRVRLVLNGVDIEKFAGAASPAPVKRAVTLGRFSANKRLDLLLDLFARLTVDDPDWKLDIFGVAFDISPADLEKMVTDRGLADHVRIGVGLPTADLRNEIGRASYFLSASEYEGFGLALIEAMSAGLVPLAQPNEAYRAFAEKHDTVTLTDFSDTARAARDLQSLHEQLTHDHATLRNAVMEAVQQYSWSRTAKAYQDIYRSCVAPDLAG